MSDPILLQAAEAFLATHAEWERITQEEVLLLKARELRQAEEIMKRRPALNESYQTQLKYLFDRREELSALPEEMKEKLRETQNNYNELGGIYQRELELALNSAERLMNLIKGTIVQEHTTSQFYGKSGAIMAQEAPRAVTINKKA